MLCLFHQEPDHIGTLNCSCINHWIDYTVQFWLQHCKKTLRRFTRILPGVDGFSCTKWQDWIGLFFLDHWRLRDNLIEVYNMMGRIDG